MVITPVQFVVSSAVTQKTPLVGSVNPSTSSSTSSADEVGNVSAPTANVAIVPDVSSQLVEASGLYNAYVSLAAAHSSLDVAQSGTQQIALMLQQLQSVATQISNSTGNGASLSQLEAEFQGLYTQIDQIASGTSFNGNSLLDGSLGSDTGSTGTDTGSQTTTFPVAVPNLTTKGLFGSFVPSVKTPADASAALTSLASAQDIVGGANNGIEEASNQVNFAMASIETAQANSYASTSTLSETDMLGAGFGGFASGLLGKPSTSANAQTGKMSDKLLSLISSN